jgi:hypothetical protein
MSLLPNFMMMRGSEEKKEDKTQDMCLLSRREPTNVRQRG